MPLISPLLWQGIPFKHTDGTLDFLGMHDRWHRMLALAVGPPVPDVRLDALSQLGDIHQLLHVKVAEIVGIEPPPDFSLYDLDQRTSWVLFMQAHSIEHERLRAAVRF